MGDKNCRLLASLRVRAPAAVRFTTPRRCFSFEGYFKEEVIKARTETLSPAKVQVARCAPVA
jgi:hypothetical protein